MSDSTVKQSGDTLVGNATVGSILPEITVLPSFLIEHIALNIEIYLYFKGFFGSLC